MTGVHFVKHCDSSYLPSVLEASDGQFPTGSCLIYSNDSEELSAELNQVALRQMVRHSSMTDRHIP